MKVLGGRPYVAYDRTSNTSSSQPCGVYLWQPGAGSRWLPDRVDAQSSRLTDCYGFASPPQLGTGTDGIHVVFSYSGDLIGLYHSYVRQGSWHMDQFASGVFDHPSAAIVNGRLDVVAQRAVTCASGCGNGLHYFRLRYDNSVTVGPTWTATTYDARLTSRSDSCDQRFQPAGTYTCDDTVSLQLSGGSEHLAFFRGGSSVMYSHS